MPVCGQAAVSVDSAMSRCSIGWNRPNCLASTPALVNIRREACCGTYLPPSHLTKLLFLFRHNNMEEEFDAVGTYNMYAFCIVIYEQITKNYDKHWWEGWILQRQFSRRCEPTKLRQKWSNITNQTKLSEQNQIFGGIVKIQTEMIKQNPTKLNSNQLSQSKRSLIKLETVFIRQHYWHI